MTLVILRLLSAVAGFVEQHGSLPTKIIVPVENWRAYREDANSVPSHYSSELTRALFRKVSLIPVPLQVYIAIDDEGRHCDYDAGEASSDWRAVEELLGLRTMNAPVLTMPPIDNSYVIPGTSLAAGEYPGSPPRTSDADVRTKLGGFLDAGISAFIDLTGPADKLAPYAEALASLANARGISVSYEQPTIKDMDVCHPEHMHHVLDLIDAKLAEGRGIYLHCWGGIGRTGMVAGCWLVRHGQTGEDALSQVGVLFRSMSPAKVERHKTWGSPQTDAQRDMVRGWAKQEHLRDQTSQRRLRDDLREEPADVPAKGSTGPLREVTRGTAPLKTMNAVESRQSDGPADLLALISPRQHLSPRLRDQMRGALVGLAAGDAVGTAVEFRTRGSFPPVTDMVGGGPFHLAPGQWTDDTSMALCLAESLIEQRAFDPRDQMERYVRWWHKGHLSSTGKFFDIGTTTAGALTTFERTGEPLSGPKGEMTAGNGSLMRLSPVPIFFFGRSEDGIALAGESSLTTHGAPVAVDACRYLAALITGALQGATKDELLSPRYAPIVGYWDTRPLHPVIEQIANGSFKQKQASAIKGSGYAAHSLEAALWAFHHGRDFRESCLMVVNLGDDADTTAAILGQLAGAFYGESAIPIEWRRKLALKETIDKYAEMLFQLAFGGPPSLGIRGTQARVEAERLIAESRGNPARALREFISAEERVKRELGVLSYHMSGSMGAEAAREELILQLRVAAGLATLQPNQ